MGKNAEAQAGTIYRWYEGQLKVVRSDITIPNAICFSPDGSTAYYADTALSRVFAIDLDVATGWPIGDERVFLDLSDAGLNPDGAVCDAMGAVWITMWGASCVIGFGPGVAPI